MRDGRFFRLSKQVLPDGGWLAVHEDVTEREKTLAHLRHLASHDPLTELGNRSLLFDRLRTLTPSDPGAGCGGLLLADLDGFKSINDRFGHSIGDALLRAVALRLRSLATDTDTVSRLGGDEFALLRPCEPDGLSGLVALGGRVIEALQEPFDIPPHRLKVGASIGIAASFGEPASPDAILRQADLALYHAKFEGRNRVAVFKPAMEIAVGYRRDLAQDLDIALDAEVITLDFQPVVNVDTGAVVVMEALARWRHPDLGPIAPSTFVPIAEEYGLVHKLGDAVFAAACRAAATWPASVRIAINVSALQVTQDTLPEVFRRHIDRAGLSAERVDLEITESALLSKDGRVIECLKDLRSMGAKIVLDDFGTGFASLSNLNTFTVDRIKIDRSFIARLGSHRGSTAIVEASTMIADAFNVMVTAEGVETEQQRAVLRALGVSQQQGYLFARPAPLAAWSFIEGRAVRTDAAPAPA